MRDTLVEIGVEELPHAVCKPSLDEFCTSFMSTLKEMRLEHGEVDRFGTPRRLCLLIRDVQERQDDFRVEKRGPSYEKAYVDGKPSKALLGFLSGNSIEEKDTVIRDTENGRYIYAVQEIEGRDAVELLPEILKGVLGSIRFPKSMRWESTGFSFSRPIRWIVFLFGQEIIPFEIAGVCASRYTFGHRAYSDRGIEIRKPKDYEKKLRALSVISNRTERCEEIRRQVSSLTESLDLEIPPEGDTLYDENTDLTEFPHAVLCRFDDVFLELPPEVLISEMIEHQHYFPLVDRKTGKLTNSFIAISNIEENSESRAGYERVLHARLDDGRFFFNEDKKKDFDGRLERLGSVTFHEKLGSMHEKVERIGIISGALSKALSLNKKTAEDVDRIAKICKNDLVTLMVGEFPGLQGIMGYYYALSSGYGESVARGIREHYLPRFADDELPGGIEGAVVGIADRLDTIMGIFSIGLRPKGSKDPFALRRRVAAIIRIAISLKLHFSLRELLERSLGLYRVKNSSAVISDLEQFFHNRIKTIFAESGFSYDEIDASLAGVLDDVYEANRRVEALHNLRGNEDFEHLLISFRRMSNIIEEGDGLSFSESLLREKEERALHRHFVSMRDRILQGIKQRDYEEVYRILSTFKPHVDNFFDHVLVMDEDMELRRNRLGLLQSILDVFSGIIDFSKIVQPGE